LEIFVNNIALTNSSVRIRSAGALLVERKYPMTLTNENEEGTQMLKSAPVAMARDPALWLDRATNLLIKTLGQWEDEEDSVQEEHEGHINDLRQFVKDWHTNNPKPHPDELTRPSRA
jgi:hypothetical protein